MLPGSRNKATGGAEREAPARLGEEPFLATGSRTPSKRLGPITAEWGSHPNEITSVLKTIALKLMIFKIYSTKPALARFYTLIYATLEHQGATRSGNCYLLGISRELDCTPQSCTSYPCTSPVPNRQRVWDLGGSYT